MKCIRKGGIIKRVSNDEAIEAVNKHGYKYCPKSEYKNSIVHKK